MVNGASSPSILDCRNPAPSSLTRPRTCDRVPSHVFVDTESIDAIANGNFSAHTDTRGGQASVPASTSFCRRDSIGGGGTNFLSNGNVVVRGPSPTPPRVDHHGEKEGGQGRKADAGFRLARSAAVVSLAASSEGTARSRGAAPSAATSVDSMRVEEACNDDDDCSAVTPVRDCASSEDEAVAVGGKNKIVTNHHTTGSFHGSSTQSSMNPPPSFPPSAQQTPLNDSLPSSGLERQLPMHPSAPASPSALSPTAIAHAHYQHDESSRTMRRIIDLNQSAMHYLAGGFGSADDDNNWALDALHKAEWMRCHLENELAAAWNSGGGGRNISDQARIKRLSRSSNVLSGVSASFTSRASALGHNRHQELRRSGSLNGRRSKQEEHERPPTAAGGDVARTSYIYQRMDFDEGMHSFADLEGIGPSDFWMADAGATAEAPEMSPAVEATLAFNAGQVHRRAGDLDAASEHYDRALDALARRGSLNDEQGAKGARHLETPPRVLIPILHNIGQLRYRRGDVALAKESYALAQIQARAIYGEGHSHVASALNCLGVLHYHDANSCDGPEGGAGCVDDDEVDPGCGDGESSTRKAMDLFHRALAIRLESLGPDHVDVATTLNNIGRIHVQLDEFDRALDYYEDALRIRRAALGPDSLDYAATAFNAGQSFHQKGQLERAAELYHEFLRVALMRFGHSHRDVAVVLSGIAQIHQEKREHDKALELYEASLCAGRAALGEDHSEIAMLLNRMGNFHFERERLDDALRCYQRGLYIERRVLPPDHPNIIVTCSNLGEIHRQRSEWDKAAKMYGDCLDILRRKHEGKDHVDIASTLGTIGLIHDQRGDSCFGLQYLQDALLMRQRLLGKDHLDVGATLVYIGTILYRRGVLSSATELFSESLRIRRAALGNDHRDVAFVLYNIALVHQQRGCHEEATEAYSETLRIERLVLGERHRDVSMTLFKLGEVKRATGDLEGALGCFRESLEVERSLGHPRDDASASATLVNTAGRGRRQPAGPDRAAMARALNEIGNIHLAQGEVSPMMEAFNEASRLYRAAGLSPNNVVVSDHLYALEFSCPECAAAA